jgi:hypothetical protein
MDIVSSYSSGSAINDLRNANKAEATTKFNEMIDNINTQAQDEETLYGTIQKTGASVVGVGAIGKGVLSNFQKLRAKITGKNSKKDGGDEDAEDEMGAEEGGAEAPTEIEMTGTTTETPYMTSEVDDVATAGDNLSADRAGDFEEEGEADLAPEPTEGLGDMGAEGTGGVLDPTGASVEVPDSETFEAVGEEGLDLGADATADVAQSGLDAVGSTLGDIVSNATSAIGNTASNVGSALGSAIDSASSAVSGAVDATTGAVATGAETALATGAEVAGATGLEAAGTALDATGVGAPIGLILNILGGIVLGGTMAAGITGEVEASNNQQSQTTDAQNQLKQATTGGLSNIAGRYAV